MRLLVQVSTPYTSKKYLPSPCLKHYSPLDIQFLYNSYLIVNALDFHNAPPPLLHSHFSPHLPPLPYHHQPPLTKTQKISAHIEPHLGQVIVIVFLHSCVAFGFCTEMEESCWDFGEGRGEAVPDSGSSGSGCDRVGGLQVLLPSWGGSTWDRTGCSKLSEGWWREHHYSTGELN